MLKKKKIASADFFFSRNKILTWGGSTVLGWLNLTFYVPQTGHLTGQKKAASPHPDSRNIMISWPAYI